MISTLDRSVGRIAGAIYGGISGKIPIPPLMLIPPVTFKVRKTLEQFTDLRFMTSEQKRVLAEDICVAIVPLLFAYELDPRVIEDLSPVIESMALKALREEV